jgi:hypothetical protein
MTTTHEDNTKEGKRKRKLHHKKDNDDLPQTDLRDRSNSDLKEKLVTFTPRNTPSVPSTSRPQLERYFLSFLRSVVSCCTVCTILIFI